MNHSYFIKEDNLLRSVLDQTYGEMMTLLKEKHPESTQLSDNEEISQLHDLYALLKAGFIKISCDVQSGVRILQIPIGQSEDILPVHFITGVKVAQATTKPN